MTLPNVILEEIQEDEMLLLKGGGYGLMIDDAPNNARSVRLMQ